MNAQPMPQTIPPHVKAELVVDFDMFGSPDLLEQPHLGYKRLQDRGPEIFYTPRNGGHWVVTRFDRMASILRDPEHFSSRELTIPKSNSTNVMIPLNLDPPIHAAFRAVLLKSFDRKSVQALEPKIEYWARELIERVRGQGGCDFAVELGARFPVSIFMELMGMDLSRFDEFRGVVHEYFGRITNERYLELQGYIIKTIRSMIAARRERPGNDLFTKIMGESVQGRPLTDSELESIGFLLFLGGLDTVANALTFAFFHLSGDGALQQRLAAEEQKLPDFVEESLRCYGVVHQTRICKKDIDIGAAHFAEGDMVSCALPAAGLDDTKNPDPLRFDLDRVKREHIAFSTGAHTCIGNVLARAEMRIFTREWLRRIPKFRRGSRPPLEWRAGQVMACLHLPLEW